MKVYAVKRGNKTGIFETWSECQEATKGFSNPDFKSFNTREEAEAYLQGKDIWVEQVEEDRRNGYLVAFTDGSFDETLQRYSYGVLLITPDGTKYSLCNYGENPKYIDSKNIIGEIFGVINALDWAVSNGYSKIKIYHDYEGLSKWVNNEWKVKSPASKMYVNLFRAKYEGVIEVEFIKVPGHSNVSYNEEVDHIAKSALIDRKKVAVQGANWYSIPYFSKEDFTAFADIVKESDNNITYTREDFTGKHIYRFKLNSDSVTVTMFDGGNHKLLVQGKNTYLFQVIATTLVELDDNSNVEQILGGAYRITINQNKINRSYESIERGFPQGYPNNICRLVRQAIVNLNYSIECEDYSQYAFPALKALEGHIKYLINDAGGTVGRVFNAFNKDSLGRYYYSGTLTNLSKKNAIENCYNYFKSQRDTAFHFGDILGATDSTRLILSKDEADEIIKGPSKNCPDWMR